MPRKKTVQPLPAGSIDFGDVVVEVWEDGVYPIGRGLHKQAQFIELCSRIFEFVVPHYVTANKVISPLDKGMMRSASALDAALDCRRHYCQFLLRLGYRAQIRRAGRCPGA